MTAFSEKLKTTKTPEVNLMYIFTENKDLYIFPPYSFRLSQKTIYFTQPVNIIIIQQVTIDKSILNSLFLHMLLIDK